MVAKIKSHQNPGLRHKPKKVSRSAFEKVYWPYIPVVLVAGALLTFGTQTGALQAAARNHGAKVLAYASNMSISGLLADTNVARSQNGVAALNLNSQLDAAAQASANDMAARNYWSHNTPEGNPPWVWVTAQGYAYQKLGQNLAAGFSDEQSTINGWMASPPHRENLLDSDFTDVGFGYANNPDYTSAGGGPMTIVVAFYGKPQQASAPASTPAAAAPTTPSSSPPSSAPASETPASSTPAASGSAPPAGSSGTTSSANQSSKKAVPATTQTDTGGITLAYRASGAQLAFAQAPFVSFATGLAVFGAVAAAGLWISRHLMGLRRAFVYGEHFAFTHPLMDVGLLTITITCYLLSQTAGLIK